MTFEQFDIFIEELLSEVRKMHTTKGVEYAHGLDRFDNFNRLSQRLDLDRLKVWLVYFTKHMDAIESYIQNKREFSDESIRGRFVDAITYLTLAAGMIAEDSAPPQVLFDHKTDVMITSPKAGGFYPVDNYILSLAATHLLRGVWPRIYDFESQTCETALKELIRNCYIELGSGGYTQLTYVLTEKGQEARNLLDKS